jgi:hypothetical protein
MAKWINDTGLDVFLDWCDDVDTLTVCETQPTTYTQATDTYMLATVAVDGGDFTKANDTSGRKTTCAEQADIEVLTTGTANWVCLSKSGDTTLRAVTSCTAASLVDGGTVTVPAWKIGISDPT